MVNCKDCGNNLCVYVGMNDTKRCEDFIKRDKVKPERKEWFGLTDQEAQWLYDNCRTPSNLIDMVEARLKEKNT